VLISYRHTTPEHTAEAETQGQAIGVLDDAIVLPWNDEAAITSAMAELGDEIAAVIAEPVLCNSGVIAPRPGFLELLRELTDDAGSLLIFDEVITGFRVAYGGAAQRYGVIPDLRTLGKALGAGAPVAGIAGRADVIDRVTSGVVHAGTYNGNPLVLCAVAAALDELGRPGTYDALEAGGQALAAGFTEALARTATAFAVNQVGPVVQCALGVNRLDTYDDYASADWALWDRIVVELLDEGVFALPGGRWYLSTAHTAGDIEATVAAFARALQRVGA
jgi:glutamate-1-semialdehyde 2,1-aminomutase